MLFLSASAVCDVFTSLNFSDVSVVDTSFGDSVSKLNVAIEQQVWKPYAAHSALEHRLIFVH